MNIISMKHITTNKYPSSSVSFEFLKSPLSNQTTSNYEASALLVFCLTEVIKSMVAMFGIETIN